MRLDQIGTRFCHDFSRFLADDRLPVIQIGSRPHQFCRDFELFANLSSRKEIHIEIDTGHQVLRSGYKISHSDHIIQHERSYASVKNFPWIAHLRAHGVMHFDVMVVHFQRVPLSQLPAAEGVWSSVFPI